MTDRGWAILPRAAALQGISPQVSHALQAVSSRVPEAVAAELRADTLRSSAADLRLMSLVDVVRPLFEAAQVPWLVLKGPVLSGYVYRVRGIRTYSDLDVLVHPHSLRRALEAIEDTGAILLTRNWAWTLKNDKREVQIQFPGGPVLDLHWHLFASPSRLGGVPLDPDMVMSRARTVPLSALGTSVPTLDQEDQFIHLAVHAVRAGMGPLRLVADIDQAWRHDRPDVETLLERAQRDRVGLLLAVALQRARRSLGTPAPADLILRLCGPSGTRWLSTMRQFDSWRPPERAHEGLALSSIRGATRSDTADSLAAAWDLVVDRLRRSAQVRTAIPKIRGRLRGGSPDYSADLAVQAQDVDGGLRERLLSSLESARR